MIPVRCFTCGNVIADKWEEFSKRVKTGEEVDKVLDDLDVKRYCCRRMLISHVNLIDEILKYDVTEDGKKRGKQI
jgi:DNA-directed RNA polymerase subunit N